MTNTPVIILVEPQMGENIGAAARAMLNCNLKNLRLVNPRDGWPSESARANSSGALELMPPVEVFETLKDAVADLNFIYSTAAFERFMAKPVMTAKNAVLDMVERTHAGQKIGIIFGRERSGLSNDEIADSHALISIPLNPEFASLNLAQAVLLVAYEWSLKIIAQPKNFTPLGKSFPATNESFEEFWQRLLRELDNGEFFRVPEMRRHIERNIKTALTRAEFSDQELKTLHGVLTALTRKRK